MRIWTFQELRDSVLSELDLAPEAFLTPDELVGYVNDAIHEAESEILKIHEDYFLTGTPITMVLGQSSYSLPANIYAQKIRSLMYINGSLFYSVKRIRGDSKFDEIAFNQQFGQAMYYEYFIQNPNPTTGYQLTLSPASRENGPLLTLWYIRSAQRVPSAFDLGRLITDPATTAQLTAPIDIPEFYTFIKQYFKAMCRAKDNHFVMPADAVALVEQQRRMMVDTLTQMVPDDDDRIQGDMTFYGDHQ